MNLQAEGGRRRRYRFERASNSCVQRDDPMSTPLGLFRHESCKH